MPGRRHGYAYQIPYRAITPRAAECANLLVPVALSCTHVGMSSIRVEPTWMILGQSAGIAAAMCAKQGVSVQDLVYACLRERLLAQRQVLELPVLSEEQHEAHKGAGAGVINPDSMAGIVLDDTAALLEGAWSRSSNFRPYVGHGYVHDERHGDGRSVATFRLKVPDTGRYEVRMAYSPHETRSKKVPIQIKNGSRSVEWVVDQTEPLPSQSVFRPIGVVQLDNDVETSIMIRNSGTDGFVILDALQLLLQP
jgi:hypothetical protein